LIYNERGKFMNAIMRKVLTTIILMAATLLSLTEANAQTLSPRLRIEGAWDAVVLDQGVPFKLQYVFAPGKTVNEGTVIFSTELDAGPETTCTPSSGAWKRNSANQFIATSKAVCNEKGVVFTVVSFDIYEISDSNNTFSGKQKLIGFNLDGKQIFSTDVALSGTILQATPPPIPTTPPEIDTGKQDVPHRYRSRGSN
jgi:hypothetical protein